MLDFDLAEMFETTTKRLKEQVRRNIERFPEDFMFELTNDEYNELKMRLRSQFATSSWGGSRYSPFAFTILGVLMLPNVLQSKKAIDTSILIVRAFNAMANVILNHPPINEVKELQNEVRQLKQDIEASFSEYNDMNEDMQTRLDNIDQRLSVANVQFSEIYQALIELADQKRELEKPRRQIGFSSGKE
jgi:DNA repair exonuclease SbcCD ATPase subunit